MRASIHRATLSLWIVALAVLCGSAGHAQNFPSRTVKVVTDVGTGGTYDIFARALSEELHKRWGEA